MDRFGKAETADHEVGLVGATSGSSPRADAFAGVEDEWNVVLPGEGTKRCPVGRSSIVVHSDERRGGMLDDQPFGRFDRHVEIVCVDVGEDRHGTKGDDCGADGVEREVRYDDSVRRFHPNQLQRPHQSIRPRAHHGNTLRRLGLEEFADESRGDIAMSAGYSVGAAPIDVGDLGGESRCGSLA
jgi:hypothetical protein